MDPLKYCRSNMEDLTIALSVQSPDKLKTLLYPTPGC